MMFKLLSLGIASALLATAPASATVYLFTIGGGSTATGTLTVQDPIAASGGSLITALSGTYNGQAITGLLPISAFAGNDNLLYVLQNPLLDGGGFSFNGAFGNRNIFFNGSVYRDFSVADITFSIREVAEGAVPEPATWAMMLIGFGAIGVSLRRRRATVAAIT